MPWSGHIGLTLLPILEEKLRDYQSVLCFVIHAPRPRSGIKSSSSTLPIARSAPFIMGPLILVCKAAEDESNQGRYELSFAHQLDLGVDFSTVDHVFQLGSPKGIARLVQRAGRSNHRPGQPSNNLHSFSCPEVLEVAAADLQLPSITWNHGSL